MILVLYHICRRKKRQNCEQVKRNLTPFAPDFLPFPPGFPQKKERAPARSFPPPRSGRSSGMVGGGSSPLYSFTRTSPEARARSPPVGLSDLEGEVRVQVQGQRRPGLAPFQDGDLPAQHQGTGPGRPGKRASPLNGGRRRRIGSGSPPPAGCGSPAPGGGRCTPPRPGAGPPGTPRPGGRGSPPCPQWHTAAPRTPDPGRPR